MRRASRMVDGRVNNRPKTSSADINDVEPMSVAELEQAWGGDAPVFADSEMALASV